MACGIAEPTCHPERVHHVDLGLLVLRLAVGLTLLAHGTNKLFGGGRIPGTARWFESMGVRPGRPNAILAATTEILAGAGVAAGLFTPLSAAGIIALMLVAIVVSHRKNGFFIFRPGQGWEYCAVLALAAWSIATIGAGAWSVDHALDLDVEGWSGAIIAAVVGLVGAGLQLAVCYRPTAPAAAPASTSS
jgi:putative oxidoreductase